MTIYVLMAAAIILAGCTVDWAHPHFSGGLREYVEDRGDSGFIKDKELDGGLNKVRAGWPVILSVTWRFDWVLGHKLPGEK